MRRNGLPFVIYKRLYLLNKTEIHQSNVLRRQPPLNLGLRQQIIDRAVLISLREIRNYSTKADSHEMLIDDYQWFKDDYPNPMDPESDLTLRLEIKSPDIPKELNSTNKLLKIITGSVIRSVIDLDKEFAKEKIIKDISRSNKFNDQSNVYLLLDDLINSRRTNDFIEVIRSKEDYGIDLTNTEFESLMEKLQKGHYFKLSLILFNSLNTSKLTVQLKWLEYLLRSSYKIKSYLDYEKIFLKYMNIKEYNLSPKFYSWAIESYIKTSQITVAGELFNKILNDSPEKCKIHKILTEYMKGLFYYSKDYKLMKSAFNKWYLKGLPIHDLVYGLLLRGCYFWGTTEEKEELNKLLVKENKLDNVYVETVRMERLIIGKDFETALTLLKKLREEQLKIDTDENKYILHEIYRCFWKVLAKDANSEHIIEVLQLMNDDKCMEDRIIQLSVTRYFAKQGDINALIDFCSTLNLDNKENFIGLAQEIWKTYIKKYPTHALQTTKKLKREYLNNNDIGIKDMFRVVKNIRLSTKTSSKYNELHPELRNNIGKLKYIIQEELKKSNGKQLEVIHGMIRLGIKPDNSMLLNLADYYKFQYYNKPERCIEAEQLYKIVKENNLTKFPKLSTEISEAKALVDELHRTEMNKIIKEENFSRLFTNISSSLISNNYFDFTASQLIRLAFLTLRLQQPKYSMDLVKRAITVRGGDMILIDYYVLSKIYRSLKNYDMYFKVLEELFKSDTYVYPYFAKELSEAKFVFTKQEMFKELKTLDYIYKLYYKKVNKQKMEERKDQNSFLEFFGKHWEKEK